MLITSHLPKSPTPPTQSKVIPLSHEGRPINILHVDLTWTAKFSPCDCMINTTCYMLDTHCMAQCSSLVIGQSNLKSTCGAVFHIGSIFRSDAEKHAEVFNIDLAKLPDNILQLKFVSSITNCKENKHNFSSIHGLSLRLVDSENHTDICEVAIQTVRVQENFIDIAEIARKDQGWEFKFLLL